MRAVAIILLLLLSAQANAQLVASVDRNRIALNETVELQISFNGRVDTGAIDFRALHDDFDILGAVQPQTSFQSINGRESYRTSWRMVLMPKRSGELSIPAFTVNGSRSDAIRIQVTDIPGEPAEQPLQVTVEVSPQRVHVQEQILVTVRIRVQSGVGNLSGSRLELPGTEVHLVDEQRFSDVEDGIAYQIAEWKYVLYPEEPMTLEIPAQIFSGNRADQRRRLFDPFNNAGQRLIARSNTASIEVEPKPVGEHAWLPASNVTVDAEWSRPLSAVRVGEPITRTIEISAHGQMASLIPPLSEQNDASYKQYRDQPRIDDLNTPDGIVGRRTESVALVPLTAGSLTLPSVSVHWWDTAQDAWRETVLPAETITVLPAEQAETQPGASAALPAPAESGESAPIEDVAAPSSEQLPAPASLRYWQWSTYLLAVCCTVLLILRYRQGSARSRSAEQDNARETRSWTGLQRAMKTGDPATIRNALIAWSRCRWPEYAVHTPETLARIGQSDELAAALRELDRTLYGAAADHYDPSKLAAALAELRRLDAGGRAARQPVLADLYPEPVSRS